MTRPGWLGAILSGALAAATAMLLQNLIRNVWQVRTLPERVMEWLLLFIPLDLFERGLADFGADAKVLAFTATFIGMAVVLAFIGALILRAGWSGIRVLILALALWLVAMGIVMPLTGAGFFATDLLLSPVLTSAAYLLVFFAYATVLILGRNLPVRREVARSVMVERRALISALVGTFAAGGLASLAGRQGGVVASSLPVAVAPTLEATLAPSSTTQSSAETPIAANAPTPAPSPTPNPIPNPPLPRHLARDKDGALTAAGRPKGELAPPITTNENFYVVTKNAVEDPIVDAATWRLIVDGEVKSPVQIDYRGLRSLRAFDVTKTLECISNFTAACNLTTFGCDLISTAHWRGARLGDVLALAGGLKSTAVGIAFMSVDEFSAGLPAEVAQDPQTLVVYEMNGEPLPREHGFPARLLVPGRYGMKNPKWLAGIRAMTQEYAGWYELRNWNKDGIVKTMARIDTPADGAMLSPGTQRIAGIAYAGERGISRVEFSLDNSATWAAGHILEVMPGKDAMVRWDGTFGMPSHGNLVLTVRATDGTGEVQTDEFQLPQPDGGSGRHQVTVSAA